MLCLSMAAGSGLPHEPAMKDKGQAELHFPHHSATLDNACPSAINSTSAAIEVHLLARGQLVNAQLPAVAGRVSVLHAAHDCQGTAIDRLAASRQRARMHQPVPQARPIPAHRPPRPTTAAACDWHSYMP
jgi:hypothetical protein